MSDNPYEVNSAPGVSGIRRPIGRRLIFGFLLLAAGEITQVVVRFMSPSILVALTVTPTGIKPSEVARRFHLWSLVFALGSAVSLIGVAMILHAVWRRLSPTAGAPST